MRTLPARGTHIADYVPVSARFLLSLMMPQILILVNELVKYKTLIISERDQSRKLRKI